MPVWVMVCHFSWTTQRHCNLGVDAAPRVDVLAAQLCKNQGIPRRSPWSTNNVQASPGGLNSECNQASKSAMQGLKFRSAPTRTGERGASH